MSNKNSNKNKQTKSVESCIKYIDGKPIVKVLFAWGYCTFVFKKELEQKFNKFKKQYSNDIPFNVMLEQFFNHLKDNCNFDFNNDGLSPEDYKTVLDLIAQDGYAKSSCCKDFYFTINIGRKLPRVRVHMNSFFFFFFIFFAFILF